VRDEDAEFVRTQLRAFNTAAFPEFFDRSREIPSINIYVREETGKIVGAIVCEIHWQTLMVDILWVDDSLRLRGVGSYLLDLAEMEGKRQGCTFAVLTTFDFQARGFYEGHDYYVIGILNDYPPGHSYYTLRKDF
jgi:ribosomal protein S18 acetylase RimI-like enzyme